jgi:hypothetical protein
MQLQNIVRMRFCFENICMCLKRIGGVDETVAYAIPNAQKTMSVGSGGEGL